jgi:hypothetical protein
MQFTNENKIQCLSDEDGTILAEIEVRESVAYFTQFDQYDELCAQDLLEIAEKMTQLERESEVFAVDEEIQRQKQYLQSLRSNALKIKANYHNDCSGSEVKLIFREE